MKIKKATINVSIDDISPHPLSSDKVLDSCFFLIEKFPDIKFSLFIPMSYWRTINNSDIDTTNERALDLRENMDFVKRLLQLPSKNFELGYHGLYHGIPGEDNNNEFLNLSLDEANLKFKEMLVIAKQTGFLKKSKPIFRPPAWRMSPEAISAAKVAGFYYLSLAPEKRIRKVYKEANVGYMANSRIRGGVTYYNVSPPWKPLELYVKTTMVYHACEWSSNYLGGDNLKELADFLEKNKGKYMFGYTESMIQKLGNVNLTLEQFLEERRNYV